MKSDSKIVLGDMLASRCMFSYKEPLSGITCGLLLDGEIIELKYIGSILFSNSNIGLCFK